MVHAIQGEEDGKGGAEVRVTNTEGPFVIRHGDVWKTRSRARGGEDLEHVCDATGMLGMVHDGYMLLHAGSAASAAEYMRLRKSKFDQMNDMLESMGEPRSDIMVVELPVSQAIVDEMNACLTISGRVARLAENLERIGDDDPSLFSRPVYPR